ncbi:zinc-binding alcohol dehydrogenase family protein [Paraburkholderia sp. SARCC-3016]|uniref:zinc-binding alcohol dehydrogenase family protein n=1 Tax=Paraburkholderia sp. SARCC-3016 TaxID=3058611 RepID=UPI0028098C4C|nr:zinc-binding alcohol dehydrogenase family protein [Paraburkholderia sp. SARCC-3016]MDQ7982020.1 zinc-binding alcohol dehydrogenase family protein [Paraburkholderia sp. SARCC-3016]
MKAVGYYDPLAISDPKALIDIDLPEPKAGERDLIVEVRAVSVNPVDTKVRKSRKAEGNVPVVLGWDAAGVVRSVGSKVTLFKPGDRVWYAGTLMRPGTNSELHAVDERIVGRMPDSIDFAAAASLPLTAVTAWEMLFDRLRVPTLADAGAGGALLIIGAAGGVGSIMVQLARKLTGLTVIGTASRPETQRWVKDLGAHHVIDHAKPLAAELARVGVHEAKYVASLTHTDQHFAQIVEALAPQGHFGLIDDPEMIDVRLLKRKSASLHWELMYTRSIFDTPDVIRQHEILNKVAEMVDSGMLKTTTGEHFGKINAENLRRAHQLLESHRAKGKIVLEGFGQ